MGFAGKVIKGTLITVGATLAVGGFIAYNASRYVKRLIYPPTFKKYLALASIPFVLYAVENPKSVANR